MRVTREKIFKSQQLIMTKPLVSFKNSIEGYHLNILVIISILCHINIESEVFRMA